MKCLVIGGSGLAGYQLTSELVKKHETLFTYLRNPVPIEGASALRLDLSEPASAVEMLGTQRPEIVFHLAANPSVDWHEREREAAYMLNAVSARLISEKMREIGAKLVYLSSAFVFPGLGKSYAEEDMPAPINFYGATKLAAELATRSNPDHIIVRTDQIYGWSRAGQKKSFVVSTLEKLSEGKKAEVCIDWKNCPTYCGDLVRALMQLAFSKKTGIYHAAGPDYVDRYAWALRIASAFNKDQSMVVPIESKALGLPAIRPNVRLSCEKLARETGLRMKGVDEGLREMVRHG